MNKEINRLIVEKILEMSYEKSEENGLLIQLEEGKEPVLFNPSEKIEDAWFVLDKVCNKHKWRAIIDRNESQIEVAFKTEMGSYKEYYGMKETAPLAICDAVLQTVGIEMEELS